MLLALWSLVAAAEPVGAARERRERRVVLSELRAGEVPRVRVAPGVATLLLFDAELARRAVALEGRGRFERVEVAERVVVVRPALELEAGERLLLEVPFADGSAPARAVFALVTEPGEVDGQVEVVRRPRTAEQLQVELEALRAQCEAGGEVRLVLSGRLGTEGLSSGPFRGSFVVEGVEVVPPWLLQASTWWLLFFRVDNPKGAAPWRPGDAVLSVPGEEARRVPVFLEKGWIGPGEGALLAVVMEGAKAAGAWRLEIEEKGGKRRIRLEEEKR